MTFRNAVQLATTALTINANAKHPGSVDPLDADAYRAAFAEARAAESLASLAGAPLIEELQHVMWRLADFSAPRAAESPAALIEAFATHLAAEVHLDE